MNDYGLKKNTEGYADPTAAATLNRKEPGDIWEYNGTLSLIIKSHGTFSTILQLTDLDYPDNVQVETCDGAKFVSPHRITYGLHAKMGKFVETLDVTDFARVIQAVEDAIGLRLLANATPREEADAPDQSKEIQELRKKLDVAQARILELEDQLDDYEGTVLGLERQLAAATSHINNGAVDKAQAEAEKAKNQLELLRDMYNDLLAKALGEG